MIGLLSLYYFLIIIYGEFVISKGWVVIISLNLLQKGKDNFTSNAYELRMDFESAAEELRLVLETCSMSSLKQPKEIFLG
jgi:hypothetical protein